MTNVDGDFTLEGIEDGATLMISYIGYVDQEVAVAKGKNDYKITIHEDTQNLDEVVVVGYGTQTKVNLTGAVSTIGKDELINRPVTNVSSALQGLTPGVTITSGTGQPGSDGATIRVRGVGTLNNANPYILVDGIESEEGPAMGGAMLAAVACGEYASVEEIAEKFVKVTGTVEPDPELVAKYEDRYQKFRQIYPACRPLFEIIK